MGLGDGTVLSFVRLTARSVQLAGKGGVLPFGLGRTPIGFVPCVPLSVEFGGCSYKLGPYIEEFVPHPAKLCGQITDPVGRASRKRDRRVLAGEVQDRQCA